MKEQVLRLKKCTHNSDGHCAMLLYKGKPAVHIVAYDNGIGFYGREPFVNPEKDSLDYVTHLSTFKQEENNNPEGIPFEKKNSGWGKE